MRKGRKEEEEVFTFQYSFEEKKKNIFLCHKLRIKDDYEERRRHHKSAESAPPPSTVFVSVEIRHQHRELVWKDGE